MTSDRALNFLQEYTDLMTDSDNEEEPRTNFVLSASSKLNIGDLKLERSRHDARRNHIIIEFKDKGLFHNSKTSSHFKIAFKKLTEEYIPEQARADYRDVSNYVGICFDGIHLATRVMHHILYFLHTRSSKYILVI